MEQLRRKGCPVDRIPKFSGRTYYCEGDEYTVYTLPDGSRCCRKAIASVAAKPVQTRKEVPFKQKEKLPDIIEKPDDPTKIFNPRTKRWVLKTGKTGKELLAGYYR